ncbi:MAG: helix-turn-helix transcriptional regulator [Chlorobi bacterium]|nr:helix-turn-helix transcriptional regulator [Chlorobiota bacterium]
MVNSEDFIKRLQKIINFYSLSAATFADKIGVQRSSISHILSGRNRPSLEFVMKVLSSFPEVNLYWLLNGTGTFPSQNESNLQDNIKTRASESMRKEIDRIVVFYKDGSFKNYEN